MQKTDKLRFAIFGTGFWSRFQLAAWYEVGGVECVALYNRTRSKAERLAVEFAALNSEGAGAPAVYEDPEALLGNEQIDFLDIITDVYTHSQFVHMAAEHKTPVICQKPMESPVAITEGMT